MPPEPKGPPSKPPGKAPTGGKAAGGIKGGLTRKVGPLPVWGWAAIAGGAFVAWTFLRGGGSGGATGADGALGVGMGGPSGGGGAGGGSGSGGGGGAGGGSVGDAIGDVAYPVTNPNAPGGVLGGSPVGQGSSGAVNTPSFIPGTADLETINAYRAINDAKAALIAAADPNSSYAAINRQLRDQFGGIIYEGQGPEENLSVQQYNDLILGGWGGSAWQDASLVNPNMGMNALDPSGSGKTGYQLWLEYLERVGPAGYVGVNSGQRDDAEYFRNLDIARQNAAAGIAVATGFGGSSSGSPPTITSLPIGNITPIAAPSTAPAPVDYSGHISTLEGYISNLKTGVVTQADRDKIALYEQRIQTYQAR